MKIKCVKVNDSRVPCLMPWDEHDREDFDKLPFQKIMTADVKRNRNPRFHDKFMKLLRIVVENSEKWQTVEQLLVALKFQMNLVDLVECFDGAIRPHPRSISFEKMDDFEFEFSVYRPALTLLAKEIGKTEYELENE